MNLVVLSSCGPFDRFLIQKIGASFPVRQVLRTTWPARPAASRWEKLRAAPWQALWQAVERRYDDRRESSLNAGIGQALFSNWPDAPELENCQDIDGWSVNGRGTHELLQSLEPDLLITTCAPLLKSSLFELPRFGSLNVHRGLAPWYRGERTLFWPLYFGDYERIGVTLHKLDRGIDTGPMLAQGRPDLAPGDNEATITAKCALLAAELVVDMLPAIYEGEALGSRHAEKGRLFLARERRPWHDAVMLMRRQVLNRRPPNLPGFRRAFHAAAEPALS